MDPVEYLTFVPLLFYGIALADLLGQWRRFFDKNCFYLPYFITTIVFTESAVWNVYSCLNVLPSLEGVGYRQYWSYLLQPILFLLTVSALTPDSNDQDTEAYFRQRLSLVYGLAAIFIASHFLTSFSATAPLTFPRVILAVLCIAIAITKKVWLIYLATGFWGVIMVERMM